jgi:hypothetical protein
MVTLMAIIDDHPGDVGSITENIGYDHSRIDCYPGKSDKE